MSCFAVRHYSPTAPWYFLMPVTVAVLRLGLVPLVYHTVRVLITPPVTISRDERKIYHAASLCSSFPGRRVASTRIQGPCLTTSRKIWNVSGSSGHTLSPGALISMNPGNVTHLAVASVSQCLDPPVGCVSGTALLENDEPRLIYILVIHLMRASKIFKNAFSSLTSFVNVSHHLHLVHT